MLGGDTITFHVTAEDAKDSQLHFTWTASTGTLGSPTSTGVTSVVIWTAPLCVPAGTTITVTVTVTNEAELSASKSFTLSANACPAAHVAGGYDHSLALRGDGTVWSWGKALLDNGTEIDRLTPVHEPGLTSIMAIAAGGSHSLALRSDGTAWAWGANNAGQLGDGSTTPHSTAVRIPALTGVTALAAGREHSLALRSDGTVWAWGSNHAGQLGDGTEISRPTPVQVAGLTQVIAIAAGSGHSLALRSDGTVWGNRSRDGNPKKPSSFSKLEAIRIQGKLV
ncbi:MAG TPA: hypothetical protein VNA24_05865 [Hyalangium sp.]|nr:hypothetical protein [Hyalangium sp.]